MHPGWPRPVRRRQRRGVGANPGRRRARHGRPREALLLGAGDAKVPAAARGAGARHGRPRARLGRHPGVSTIRAHVYGLLTHPSVPPLDRGLVMAQSLGNVGRRRLHARVPDRLRGRVQDLRMDAARPLPARPPLSGTVGTFGACAAAAKLLRLEGREAGPCARHGRQHGGGHPLQLRHHDEAAPCRPRGGERRDRGAAGRARLHRRPGRARRPLGLLPGAGRAASRGEDRRRASARPGRSSSPACQHQAVPVRHRHPSVDGRHAEAGARSTI